MKRLATTILLALAACAAGERAPAGECVEDPRALVQPRTATVRNEAGAELPIEVADTYATRQRGLQYRRCDVTGLLLVSEAPGTPLPIWMCRVEGPLDLAFLRDGQVVHLEENVPPCPPPCSDCPVYGRSVRVDGVLETPAGSWPLREGERVEIRLETLP